MLRRLKGAVVALAAELVIFREAAGAAAGYDGFNWDLAPI